VRQTFSGTTGAFDYRVSGLYRDIRDFYDADGNVIPPQLGSGIQDSKVKAFSTKLGYNFGRQRIEGSFSYYDQPAEIKWAVRNGNIATGVPASAIPAGPQPGQVEEENKAKVGNLVFSDPSIFGTSTSFRAQGYYVDTLRWFQYALNRFPLFPEAPSGQSGNMTKKTGARFDLNTPMKAVSPLDGSILWGLDLMRDDTKIPLVDGRQFGIPQVLNSVAAFVQLQLNLTQRLKLSAGIRHEDSKLDVSDYLSVFTRARITGGRLDFKTNPGNAGLVFSITNWLDVYGGWSQGFDIQQTSQNFRAWPVDINLVATKPPANVIDSYEAGFRFNGAGVKGSIGVYQVESSNGISYVFNAATPNEPRAVVAPDRIRGIEAIVDYNGLERWNLGATFARNFGYADNDNNGTFETPLQNRRIPPPSVTAHAEYELTPTSFVRAQLLWSGDRNAFPTTVPGRFHEGHVHPYTTVDVSSRFILAKNMELALGVRNLFNRDYYTNYSEGFNTNDNYMKAPGRTFTVRFAVNY
jgi:iron complex outermembrane receptor protein